MSQSLLLLAITIGLLAVLVAIAARAYRSDREEDIEAPKHRMLEED